MSDFDKEAEREKLRKKYEREEEKRKNTEQMSELLLKGATMTNAHCSDCGDPIFRYDGQEFCPTCQRPVDRETGDDSPADDGGGAEEATGGDGEAAAGTDDGTGDRAADEPGDEASGEGIEVTAPSADATVRFGDQESPEDATHEGGDRSDADGRPAHSDRGATDEPVRRVPSAKPPGRAAGEPDEPAATTRAPSASSGSEAGGHVDRARALLAQTLERFARRAAETENPREARAHLEAAREAAETLDAADRSSR